MRRFWWRIRNLSRRLKVPFQTHVFFHERSKIEIRLIPPKLQLSAHKSIQERIDEITANGGGSLVFETGTHFLSRSIELTGKSNVVLEGGCLDGRLLPKDQAAIYVDMSDSVSDLRLAD